MRPRRSNRTVQGAYNTCEVAHGKSFQVCIVITVEIIETTKGQAVPLPEEFRFSTSTVTIRRQGDAVIVEPVKPASWPEHFFDAIRIEDPAFRRPDQGTTPPAPTFD